MRVYLELSLWKRCDFTLQHCRAVKPSQLTTSGIDDCMHTPLLDLLHIITTIVHPLLDSYSTHDRHARIIHRAIGRPSHKPRRFSVANRFELLPVRVGKVLPRWMRDMLPWRAVPQPQLSSARNNPSTRVDWFSLKSPRKKLFHVTTCCS